MSRPTLLYHATLKRNVSGIEADGLVPQIGAFTRGVYGDSDALVPAIFAVTARRLESAVRAMVAHAMDEVTDELAASYSLAPAEEINDALCYALGALCVLEKTPDWIRSGRKLRHQCEPGQAESGDWYSLVPVRPVRILVGDALENFLESRGLAPSSLVDFVAPNRHRT